MIEELFSLDGRVALVTGGNGGIGRGMALGLQSAGARVAVTGRDPERNASAARELGDDGLVLELEVSDEEEVERVVARVVERFGRLDILINNAGLGRPGSLLDLTREDWQTVIDAHLTGSFLCAKHVARRLRDQGQGGKIVNIGSMYSLFGAPLLPNYSAAKTGVLGLTRSLATDLARFGIQVNAILPGWYETGLTQGLPQSQVGEKIRRHHPTGRWGEMEDLVGTAVFLCSRASDYVTGVAIPVDGGYSASDGILLEDWSELL